MRGASGEVRRARRGERKKRLRARIEEARHKPGILADGLLAWARGEDGHEVQASVFVVAEIGLLVRTALTQKR